MTDLIAKDMNNSPFKKYIEGLYPTNFFNFYPIYKTFDDLTLLNWYIEINDYINKASNLEPNNKETIKNFKTIESFLTSLYINDGVFRKYANSLKIMNSVLSDILTNNYYDYFKNLFERIFIDNFKDKDINKIELCITYDFDMFEFRDYDKREESYRYKKELLYDILKYFVVRQMLSVKEYKDLHEEILSFNIINFCLPRYIPFIIAHESNNSFFPILNVDEFNINDYKLNSFSNSYSSKDDFLIEYNYFLSNNNIDIKNLCYIHIDFIKREPEYIESIKKKEWR